MANAITSISPSTAQYANLCEASGGTSTYCSLYVRPLPFSNHTAANFPLYLIGENLNAARQTTGGWDMESNYHTELADIYSKLPGAVAIRVLGSFQPFLKTYIIPGQAPTQNAGVASNTALNVGLSKWRANLNVNYTLANFSATVSYRWQSPQWSSNRQIYFDTRSDIPAYAYTDLTLTYRMRPWGHEMESFVNVQNLFNVMPPILGSQAGVPGLNFPAAAGFDVVGRYVTIGMRGRF
jgi:outer membrane receptor protein involved in Fe transport